MTDKKVALVTGATSGIGFALVERLLMDHRNLHVCITGRNRTKLDNAIQVLRTAYPSADLSSILLDVSDSRSVLSAVEEVQKRLYRLDMLFLNAGMMPKTTIRWKNVLKGLFSGKIVHMLLTGDGMLEASPDKETGDGLPETFATNIFGHFLMITELEELLSGPKQQYSQLIWTSSGSALVDAFDENDITCSKGPQPYASSKYCVDALSLALNEKWNSRGIYSHVVCPGTVVTNMTLSLLPQWFWWMLMPIFFLLRVVVRSFTLTLESGTTGLVWLAKQDPRSLDCYLKIFTRANWFGTYLDFKKVDVDNRQKGIIVDQLSQIRKRVLQDIRGVR